MQKRRRKIYKFEKRAKMTIKILKKRKLILDELPYWSWNVINDNLNEAFNHLKEFKEKYQTQKQRNIKNTLAIKALQRQQAARQRQALQRLRLPHARRQLRPHPRQRQSQAQPHQRRQQPPHEQN